MKFWTVIEQTFKYNGMRLLEIFLGRKLLTPDDIEIDSIKRILIIRQHDQLGDFLLSTPLFRALREYWPNALITLLIRGYTEPVARNNQFINDILVLHEIGYDWSGPKIRNFWQRLRSGYDLTVVINTVSHSLSSDLLAWLSGARYILGPSHRLFPGTTRNFFYNLISPYNNGSRHQAE